MHRPGSLQGPEKRCHFPARGQKAATVQLCTARSASHAPPLACEAGRVNSRNIRRGNMIWHSSPRSGHKSVSWRGRLERNLQGLQGTTALDQGGKINQ